MLIVTGVDTTGGSVVVVRTRVFLFVVFGVRVFVVVGLLVDLIDVINGAFVTVLIGLFDGWSYTSWTSDDKPLVDVVAVVCVDTIVVMSIIFGVCIVRVDSGDGHNTALVDATVVDLVG